MHPLDNHDLVIQSNENCEFLKATVSVLSEKKAFNLKFTLSHSASFVAVMTNCTIREEELETMKSRKSRENSYDHN